MILIVHKLFSFLSIMASTVIFNEFELDILDIDKLLNEEDDEIWLIAPSSHEETSKKRQSMKQKRLEQVDRFKTHVIFPTEFLMAAAECNIEVSNDLGMKIILGPNRLPTSLKVDLYQDIKGGFAFSMCASMEHFLKGSAQLRCW